MFDVVTFGAATVDIFIKSPQLVIKDGLLGIPTSSKNEVSQSLFSSGGGATNAATTFSRLKLKVACASLIGSDPLSQIIINDLDSEKIDQSLIIKNSDNTDFSVILVDPVGGRSIFTNRGLTSLEAKHINWSKLTSVKWFYITSLEGNIDLLEQLIGFAVEHKIKLSFNPGRRELNNLRRLIPLLQHLDFLLLNKTESEILTSLTVNHTDFWDKLTSFGPQIIAVTNGRDGAYISTSGQKFYSPIINTTPVDETGAGDAFGSGFIGGLVYGQTPENALFWGIKNSAAAVSALGAKPGLLTYDQIAS
ncbi:carbohydrate kinase family protein [Candidatus Shapirobacteria bacterium]|nr:carbohydrate kinase family protein [Candidatus Shapirobacteria bacterium]